MTDIIYMVFGLAFGAGLGWLIAKVQTTVEKRRSAAPQKNLPGDRSLTSKEGEKVKEIIIKEDEK